MQEKQNAIQTRIFNDFDFELGNFFYFEFG